MRYLLTLLLCALFLGGCEARCPSTPTVETTAPSTQQNLYVPGSAIERSTSGSVKAFPLPMGASYGMQMQGEDVLILSGSETTTLTRLAGSDLHIAAEVTLPLHLEPEELTVSPAFLSYCADGQMVVLDAAFAEMARYPLPDKLTGKPLLSEDRNTLYYCTEGAVMAWDIPKNLHRTLKMMSYPQQELEGLFRNDSILQCRIQDGSREVTLFLSAQTGQILHRREGSIRLSEADGFYFADFPTGMYRTYVFGTEADRPFVLTPKDPDVQCLFLPQSCGAVSLSTGTQLEYYDLPTGQLTATLSLPQPPDSIASSRSDLWLLVFDSEFGCPTLYRWDYAGESTEVYTTPHHTQKNPDLEGLEQCRAYAARLGEKYGIPIRIWKDATAVQPWDYDLEVEFSVPVIRRELERLDACLSQYPKGLLADTASRFSSLSICLVRKLTGRTQTGSLDIAIGIQFTQGTDAYLVLAAGKYAEHGLYHEFYHLMEPHILENSTALHSWEQLNPAGFAYDYSYAANSRQDSEEYLHREDRAFVDTYSMSFPKEDRARILEYAMLPGNEDLFRSPTLQRKLQTLCSGIREAYALEEPPLWEQYLSPEPTV